MCLFVEKMDQILKLSANLNLNALNLVPLTLENPRKVLLHKKIQKKTKST